MSPASINIEIRMNPSATLAQGDMSFGKAPIVGNDSQWPAFSQSVNSRITGSDSAKAGLFDGSNPWSKNDGKTGERAAIGWTMQQNDKLRYDADSKQFYTTGADGGWHVAPVRVSGIWYVEASLPGSAQRPRRNR